MDVLNLKWQYEGPVPVCEVAATPPPVAAPPAAAAAPPPSPPVAPGAAASPPPTTAPTIDWKTAPEQLRTEYERLKAEHESYSSLGSLDDIKPLLTSAQAMYSESIDLGIKLGYSEEEIAESFQTKPAETLQWLREKSAAAPTKPGDKPEDTSKLMEKILNERLKPIEERHNLQLTEAANTKFTNEFTRLASDDLKDEPKEVKDFLYDVTSELMKYDDQALTRLKMEGKVADIAKYYTEAKTVVFKVFNLWMAAQIARTGQKGPGQPNTDNNGKKFSLDDMAEGNFPSTMSVSKQ